MTVLYLFFDNNQAEIGYYDDSEKSCGESRSNLKIIAKNIPIQNIANLIKYNYTYDLDSDITLSKSSFKLVNMNVTKNVKPDVEYEDIIILDRRQMHFIGNEDGESIYVHQDTDWTRVTKEDYDTIVRYLHSYNYEESKKGSDISLQIIKRPKTENVTKILKSCQDIQKREKEKEELKALEAQKRRLQRVAKDKDKKEKLLTELVKELGAESVEKIISKKT